MHSESFPEQFRPTIVLRFVLQTMSSMLESNADETSESFILNIMAEREGFYYRRSLQLPVKPTLR
jgi:hypothetical protein